MNIKETFLRLTNHTYPHGHEEKLFEFLPMDILQKDKFGNLFIQIGESDVMFTSHLDTATSANTPVKHVFEGNIIKTDGKSILGADDKAGVTVMLYMISKNIPGLYYFFLGEEVGCVGSKKVSSEHSKEKIAGIKKVISFDRRGTGSIITHQASSRCCSDNFGKELAKLLNEAESTFDYKIDPTGVYTDSAQFVKIYPECTNISVGYYSEHTHMERQDISHLEKLAEACTKIDWVSLPVERDPSVVDYRYSSYYGDDWDYGYSNSYRRNYNPGSYTPPPQKNTFWDKDYKKVSSYTLNSEGLYTAVDIHMDRLKAEKDLINDLINSLEIEHKYTTWDGVTLSIINEEGFIEKLTRNDLIEYLFELDLKSVEKGYSNYYRNANCSGVNYGW